MTIHLIYPHGDRISCPDAIGRKLSERLRRTYPVINYDWTDCGVIEPGDNDVLIGHPHPAPWTVFRRSVRRVGWRRRIVLAPYNHAPGQVAFADRSVRTADLFLAITGRYWFDTVHDSAFAHWRPKMIHVDLAVDRADFPPIKRRFNGAGRRRFLYIGHASRMKNLSYLGKIACSLEEHGISWIGAGRAIDGLLTLGERDFRDESARRLVADHDFLISPASADANPVTILEAMAWGIIPICTPQSGYVGQEGIINIPLDDVAKTVMILNRLQYAPEEELERRQQKNWEALERHFNWDRFATQIMEAIESTASPPAGRTPSLARARLALASATDRRSMSFRRRALRRWLPRRERPQTSRSPGRRWRP